MCVPGHGNIQPYHLGLSSGFLRSWYFLWIFNSSCGYFYQVTCGKEAWWLVASQDGVVWLVSLLGRDELVRSMEVRILPCGILIFIQGSKNGELTWRGELDFEDILRWNLIHLIEALHLDIKEYNKRNNINRKQTHKYLAVHCLHKH